jgi:hypothetical protein
MAGARLGFLTCALACSCSDPELVAGRWVDLEQNGVHRNIAVSSGGTVFVASRPAVLRSRDRLTFEEVGERLDIAHVAVDFQDHLYAGIESYEASPTPLRVSFDGGDSWSAAAVPAGINATAIAADPTMPGRVYLFAGGDPTVSGLYRSDDGGSSFARTADTGGILAVGADGTVFLARYNGFWRSGDQGVSFVNTGGLADPNLSPRFVLTDPGDAGHLIVGTQNGLHTSANGGTTWTRTDPGVTTSLCSVIYQDAVRVPGSPNEIYMAVNAAGILYSPDNGVTWEARNQGLSADCISPHGIGVVSSPQIVVYITATVQGGDSIFAYLTE